MQIVVAITCLISLILLTGVNGRTDIQIIVKQQSGTSGISSSSISGDDPLRPEDKCVDTFKNATICENIENSGRCDTQGAFICKRTCNLCRPPACGTESKCGIKGGFCIPKDEICNGNTIKGEGYCSGMAGCKCCFTPTVYMIDIENTIAFALRNRMVLVFNESMYRETITPAEQTAVIKFIQVLREHLPLRLPVDHFLKCLEDCLKCIGGGGRNITGKSLERSYRFCGSETTSELPTFLSGCKITTTRGELPKVKTWVGCRNTNRSQIERLRTYPCGIWTTFHTITVNLKDGVNTSASSVLPTLAEVVKYFPWCTDCQKHFKHMYAELKGFDMKTAEDVTMWLWRAHNKVSVRITDGFDGPRTNTFINNNCDVKPQKVDRLQTLLSVCKLKCKSMRELDPESCRYIEVPAAEDSSACSFCKRGSDANVTIYPDRMRYNLNTAPETPGQRKSLFPEYKLCPECWKLADYNNIYDFKTLTNKASVLEYLKKVYNHGLIVGNSNAIIAKCSPPCVNGECIETNKCECPAGWEGDTCNTFFCKTGCQAWENCTGPNECTCQGDYIGSTCQEKKNVEDKDNEEED